MLRTRFNALSACFTRIFINYCNTINNMNSIKWTRFNATTKSKTTICARLRSLRPAALRMQQQLLRPATLRMQQQLLRPAATTLRPPPYAEAAFCTADSPPPDRNDHVSPSLAARVGELPYPIFENTHPPPDERGAGLNTRLEREKK